MKNLYKQKTKWQRLTRGFSWWLSVWVIVAFSLGFTPFDNQDMPVAKATTLTSVYAEAAASSTATTSWVTKLTGSFTSGNTYFIYVTLGLTNNNATYQSAYRIVYDVDGDDEEVLYTGAIDPTYTTVNYYNQVDWMDVYTPTSTHDLSVQFISIGGTTTAINAVLMGLDLTTNKVIENYDYYFDENTTLATHTSTGYADKASITLNNADGVKDWLVFGSEHITVNSYAISHTARFNYDSSYSMDRSMQGGNEADYYSFAIYRSYDNVPRGTTIAMQVGDDDTGSNQHVLSRIFALNLQVFRDNLTFYSGDDVNLEGTYTDLYRSADPGPDYYPASSTGTHIFFSSYINNVTTTDARSNNRFRVVSPTYPPSWDWTDGAGGRGKTSQDATDETSNNIAAALTVSAGATMIIWQAYELTPSWNQVADERSFAMFSAELNYRPQINTWRWYADEEDTTPGTAYAAEETEPDQVEMGKSIGMKLRISFDEVGGLLSDASRKKLYFSTASTGPWTEVGATDAVTAFRYYDVDTGGANDGDDNTDLDSTVLSGSPAAGIYNKSNSADPSESDHAASTTTEFEYSIENFNATANTRYYFAFFDETIGLIPPADGVSLPSLLTASSYDLTIEAAPSSVDLGSWAIGSSEYASYNFTGKGEEIQIRDNRGRTGSPPSGNSSGWSLTASMSTELSFCDTGTLGNITFIGFGLDDMSHNNTYTLCSAEDFYVIVTDTLASPDLVAWSSEAGGGGFGMSTDWVELEDGVRIKWDAVDGHTFGDMWTFSSVPGSTTTITKENTYWISDTITGLFAAPTTNISTQPGSDMTSAVTAASVSGNAKDGLGGFTIQPTLRMYNASTVGLYTGVLTFTLT